MLFLNKEDLNLTLITGFATIKTYLAYIKNIKPTLVKNHV